MDKNDFELKKEIGGGGFGVVWEAVEKSTGRVKAVKQIRVGKGEHGLPVGAFREIQSLHRVLGRHPNVVEVEVVFAKARSLCLVMDMADCDLRCVLDHGPLNESLAKYILKEILRGVAFCHSKGIMHRDLKPSNILVWFSSGAIKLSDFGLSRPFQPPEPNQKQPQRLLSHQVATRWYRAPELLLGSRKYDEKVDLWSVGAIAGELTTGAPIFPGENDIEQLYRVMQVLGSIDSEIIRQDMKSPPDAGKIEFAAMECIFRKFFEPTGFSREYLQLVQALLHYSPVQRLAANQALEMDWTVTDPVPRLEPLSLLQHCTI